MQAVVAGWPPVASRQILVPAGSASICRRLMIDGWLRLRARSASQRNG
jgi:hypothetical protein